MKGFAQIRIDSIKTFTNDECLDRRNEIYKNYNMRDGEYMPWEHEELNEIVLRIKQLEKELLFKTYIDEDFDNIDEDLLSSLENEFLFKPARDLIQSFIEEGDDFETRSIVMYSSDYIRTYIDVDYDNTSENEYVVQFDFNDEYYVRLLVEIEFGDDGDEILYDYYDNIEFIKK